MSTMADGFIDGIRAVSNPGRGLASLRAEMAARNEQRLALVRNLSRSTSRASKSTSRSSSNGLR